MSVWPLWWLIGTCRHPWVALCHQRISQVSLKVTWVVGSNSPRGNGVVQVFHYCTKIIIIWFILHTGSCNWSLCISLPVWFFVRTPFLFQVLDTLTQTGLIGVLCPRFDLLCKCWFLSCQRSCFPVVQGACHSVCVSKFRDHANYLCIHQILRVGAITSTVSRYSTAARKSMQNVTLNSTSTAYLKFKWCHQ